MESDWQNVCRRNILNVSKRASSVNSLEGALNCKTQFGSIADHVCRQQFFIVDITKEHIAVAEAKRLNIQPSPLLAQIRSQLVDFA